MEPVSEWIHHRFPAVRSLGTDAVEQLLREDRERLLLLDVRSPAEYEVSHLEGAVRVDPETTDMEQVVRELGPAGSSDRALVCYCTTGFHASQMAQKLCEFFGRDSGPSVPGTLKVYNLDGGFLKWNKEGKPMVGSSNQLTRQVHPYSQLWEQLLEADFRPPV
ncbi:thiosulfate sulfurtransferase GlpE-like isoform X2 [Pristis pectinata]|uniref:thiosulfate sulfurtransferase GlpE-like isoform X2 n=1 Tax=Pristis pectinata TaxID=685728 RepID=UPI00223E743C|nr:thiosulfate sulfurtransferase GlpE-like isoform X2 [Pristis pectinata]